MAKPEQVTAAAAPVAPAPAPENQVNAVIDRWFVQHIHGSPVARSTEAFNHLREALTHLKHDLTALIAKT